eukprot:m.470243 g.470243  ORF g.470243 m.470243 type:complete len:573 (-) comp29563_c0_seq1:188-1906(-)
MKACRALSAGGRRVAAVTCCCTLLFIGAQTAMILTGGGANFFLSLAVGLVAGLGSVWAVWRRVSASESPVLQQSEAIVNASAFRHAPSSKKESSGTAPNFVPRHQPSKSQGGGDVETTPLLPAQPNPSGSAIDVGTPPPSPTVPFGTSTQISSAPGAPLQQARLPYIDNLRTCLAALVVTGHVSTGFFGSGAPGNLNYGAYHTSFQTVVFGVSILGQAFLMALFFFLAGYCTPGAYDRKGRTKFLEDRFLRLGVPATVYILVLGPLLDLFVNNVAVGRHLPEGVAPVPYEYMPFAGPTWFIVWLLIFTAAYAAVDDSPGPPFTPPPLWILMATGALMGVLQLGMLLATGPNFGFMPVALNSFYFYVWFFVGGVRSKRKGWFDDTLPGLAAGVATVVMVAAAVAVYTWVTVTGVGLGPLSFPTAPDYNASQAEPDQFNLSETESAILVGFFAYFGMFCWPASIAMLALFRRLANTETSWGRWFSQQAFVVYLIHPWVLTPLTYSYAEILLAWRGVELIFKDPRVPLPVQASGTDFGADWLVWLGWGYVLVTTHLIVWPLAAALRKIPGIRAVV